MISIFLEKSLAGKQIYEIGLWKLGSTEMSFSIRNQKFNTENASNTYYHKISSDSGDMHILLSINNSYLDGLDIVYDSAKILHSQRLYKEEFFNKKELNYPFSIGVIWNDVESAQYENIIETCLPIQLISHSNAFEVVWGECNSVHFLNDLIGFQLSKNNELVGIIILKNLDGIFDQEEVDIIL